MDFSWTSFKTNFNVDVLKQPRGYFRLFQLVLAFVAFVSTFSFSTRASLDIQCINGYHSVVNFNIRFPLNLKRLAVTELRNCSFNSPIVTQRFSLNYELHAYFFTAVCTVCILYTLCALVVYTMWSHMYRKNPMFPVVDLIANKIMALFWLTATFIWIIAVVEVGHFASPSHLIHRLRICRDPRATCSSGDFGDWTYLYMSVIIGFMNVIVWVTSIWFVFKETAFYRPQSVRERRVRYRPQEPPPPYREYPEGLDFRELPKGPTATTQIQVNQGLLSNESLVAFSQNGSQKFGPILPAISHSLVIPAQVPAAEC